jgi:hypothetical protein
MLHGGFPSEGVRMARPHRAALQARLATFALAAVAACGAERVAPATSPITWSRDTLYVTTQVLDDFTDSSAQRDVIQRAFHIRATSGHLFVSDVGSDRIAVLDSAANVVRWIGNRGRGPGELLGVSHLAVDGSRLFVAEAFNGRVSEFTHDGRFVATYRAPFAAGAVAASARSLFTASQSRSSFGVVLTRGAEPARALPRARRIGGASRGRWPAVPGHDLIAADSVGVWVFDQGPGDVCFYAAPRARPHCRSLPTSLHVRLHQYRVERVALVESATRQHVSAAPLAKDMVRVGTWLALLLPLPEMPIVLLDVDDGSLTPALMLRDTLPPWARSATSFAFDGRRFVVVGDDGIGRLHLSRRHNLH